MKIEDVVTDTEGLKRLLDFVASKENVICQTEKGMFNVPCFYINGVENNEAISGRYVVKLSTYHDLRPVDYVPRVPQLFQAITESMYKPKKE